MILEYVLSCFDSGFKKRLEEIKYDAEIEKQIVKEAGTNVYKTTDGKFVFYGHCGYSNKYDSKKDVKLALSKYINYVNGLIWDKI